MILTALVVDFDTYCINSKFDTALVVGFDACCIGSRF